MSPREITLAIDALAEAGKLAEVKTFLQGDGATAPKAALQYHLPLVVAAEIQRRMVAEGNVTRPVSVAAPAPHPIPAPAQPDAQEQAQIAHKAGWKARAKAALNMTPADPLAAAPRVDVSKGLELPPAVTQPVVLVDPAAMDADWPVLLAGLTPAALVVLSDALKGEQERRRHLARIAPRIDKKKAALAAKIKALQQEIKGLEKSVAQVMPAAFIACPDCARKFVGQAALSLHRVRKHGWRKAKVA